MTAQAMPTMNLTTPFMAVNDTARVYYVCTVAMVVRCCLCAKDQGGGGEGGKGYI